MTLAFRPALLYAGLYATMFAVIGTMLPYWPVWLSGRSLDAPAIGLVIGATQWSKVVINPIAGSLADRTGKRRGLMMGLAILSFLCFAALTVTDGFWLLFLFSALASSLFASLMPLSEVLTLRAARDSGLDYGRIRLWGSISFVLMALGVGPLVGWLGTETVIWTILFVVACTIALLPALPAPPVPPAPKADGGLRQLSRNRPYLLMLAAAGFSQASHAVYYGFSSLHWLDAGLSETMVGLLWAIGVVAEILLFAFGKAVLARIGPAWLLMLGAASGLIRWPLMALTSDPLILAAVQLLHAGTFGAAHLGAMYLLSRTIAPELSGRAQALYSSVSMGALVGIAVVLAGPLYAALGAWAFLTSALWSAVGCVAAWKLLRSGEIREVVPF